MDEEESKKFRHFTEIGVKAFYESIKDLKKNKRISKPTKSVKERWMGWVKGGAGCVPVVGSILKSAIDDIWATSDQAKYEKERGIILTWTDSNSNEKLFLSVIAEGMAYICTAFKDQLKTIRKNDYNDEVFNAEVVRRVLKYLKEKSPESGQTLDSKMFYNAFINGRSTPGKVGKQFKTKVKTKNVKKVARGMKFDEGQNTWDIFENTGLLIPNEELGLDVMVKLENLAEENIFEVKKFRFMHPFERKNNLAEYKILEASQAAKLKETVSKHDWRFQGNLLAESVAVVKKISLPTSVSTKVGDKIEELCFKTLQRTDIEMMPLAVEPTSAIAKWWPEEKKPIKSFFERKSKNEILTDRLKRLLLENENESKMAVISGLAGIGKSTLAKQFAQQFQEDYEHIFWIDSDKGILIKAFQNLARDLILKNRLEIEIDLKQLATNIYKFLHNLKCLFFFDNAESYRGEFGIQEVLPKDKKFHVIITSRNTDWGNSSGHGEIPQLKMTAFDVNDSVTFLKKHSQHLSNQSEVKLENLCDLLGNLPLALQIAVAYVNKQETENIQDYIDIITTTAHILTADYADDYEKTILATMQISLDIIKNHERDDEGVADEMLKIFAYITPDDVPAEFFLSVLSKEEKKVTCFSKIKEAFNTCSKLENSLEVNKAHISDATSLLESYSLITQTKTSEGIQKLSIHRLLQQVIRHKEKDSEYVTIKRILKCQGFLDYKLLPFTTYGSNKIGKRFPNLKAEFIQKLELHTLLKERKFREAVQLSKMMKEAMKNETSLFNFAVCLKYDGEIDEAKSIFKNVLSKVKGSEFSYDLMNFNEFGIVDLKQTLTKQVVAGQLFLIHLNGIVAEKAEKLIRDSKGVIFPMSKNSLNDFVKSVDCDFLSRLPQYSLVYNEEWKYCSVNLSRKHDDTLVKSFQMRSCTVDEKNVFPQDLQELYLEEVELLALNPIPLQTLKINTKQVSLSHPLTIPKIHLENVEIFNDSNSEWISKSTTVELRFLSSALDISVLPQSLTQLVVDSSLLINLFPLTADSVAFPLNLKELEIRDIKLKDEEKEETLKLVDISFFLPPRLSQFKLYDCFFTRVFVSLKCLQGIQNLHLCDCALIINPNYRLCSSKQLFMRNVTFVEENTKEEIPEILANDFVDLNQMQHLELRSNKGLSIDLSETLNVGEVSLYETKVVNWDKKKWNNNIRKLEVYPDPDEKEKTNSSNKYYKYCSCCC